MGAYSSLFGIYYLSAASHHVRISNMYFHTIRFDIQSSIKYYVYLLSVYLKFLNWFTSITYILNALTESLHAIFQFLKTNYNVFKH